MVVDARIMLRDRANAGRAPEGSDEDAVDPRSSAVDPAVDGRRARGVDVGDDDGQHVHPQDAGFGYPGAIYPIHPKASEIENLPCFRALAETPQPSTMRTWRSARERSRGVARSEWPRALRQVISSGSLKCRKASGSRPTSWPRLAKAVAG